MTDDGTSAAGRAGLERRVAVQIAAAMSAPVNG